MSITVGSILFELRTKTKKSQIQLCENLCAPSVYSLYENNISEPDILLMTYLFERLGKCTEGITAYVAKEEADYLSWRRKCIGLIQKNHYEELEKLYKNRPERQRNINKAIYNQFDLYIEGVIQETVYTDMILAKDLYEQAIYCTCGFVFERNLEQCFVGKNELGIYAIYLNLVMQIEVEKKEECISKLYDILEYVKKNYVDDKEKMEVYSLVTCILVKMSAPRNTPKRKYRILQEAANLLRRGNGLIHAIEVFRLLVVLGEGECEDTSKYRNLYIALSQVYDEFGYPIEFNYRILFLNHFMYATINQYLQEGRTKRGYTQEEACTNICATESYSRIETGKRKPQPNNYGQLAEKFGIEKRYYTEMIDTNSVSVLNLRKKIANAIYLEDDEKYYKYVKKIQSLLDINSIQNRQYMDSQNVLYLHHKKKLSHEEYLERLIAILSQSLALEDIGRHKHVYTKLEINLINWIAAAYGYMKDYKKSCELLNRYLSDIYKDNLSIELRHIEVMMAEFNYGIALSKNNDEQQGVIHYCAGISLLLECCDADMLDKYISELVCNWDNLGIKQDITKWWKSVLTIMQFYGDEKRYRLVEKYINSKQISQ